MGTGRAATTAFVGRARERLLLQHLLHGASEGGARTAVVSGPPGAGKTTLLRWAIDEARRAGATVLNASGTDGVLPYATISRLLRPVAPPGSERSSALHLAPGEDPVDELRLAGAVTSLVLSLARRGLVAIVADDVQAIDAPSQRVLEEVVASLDDASASGPVRCFSVLATRDVGGEEALADRVLRLGGASAVPIAGLNEQEVYDLLGSTGVRPNPRMVTSILQETGGLPLLVEAAAERLARAGSDLHAELETPRVRSISDALRPRFEKVDRATNDLLSTASVLDEPWSAAQLARLAGVTAEQAAAAMDLSGDARLVTRAGGGWRFEHPLVRTEVQQRLTRGDRERLHARAAAIHLSDPEVGADDLLRAANHLASAGGAAAREDVADVCWRAGDICFGRNAWELASRLRTAATEASAGAVTLPEQAARHLAAADAAYMAHDPAECERHVAMVMELAGPHDAPEAADLRLRGATQLVQMRLGETPLRPGRRPPIEELETALRSPGVDPSAAAVGSGLLASALFVSGETERALALVAEARRSAPVDASDLAICRLEFGEGLHRLTGLELADAHTCFDRSVRSARACRDSRMEVATRSRRALVALLWGDLDAAETELRDVQHVAEEQRLWGEAGYAASQRAHAAVVAGRPDSTELIDRGIRLHRRSGFTFSGVFLAPAEAAAAARAGRPDRLDELLPNRAAYSSSAMAALSAVDAGDAAGARAVVSSAAWRHGFRGPPSLTSMVIAVALVEAGDLLEDRALLDAAREPLEALHRRGVRVTVGWPALVPRLLATVERWQGRHDESRRRLDEASAIVQREGLDAEDQRVHLELASLLLDLGDHPDGEAALAAAVAGFERLGMRGWVRRGELVAERRRLPVAALGSRVRDRTILTTDVVGSTATNVRLGDSLYLEQLRVHDRIVRSRLEEFDGVEVKHTGDGVNAVFEHSADAIRCAVAVQDDFAAWRSDEPELALEVRCGVSRGPATPLGRELHGLVQAEAARICAHCAAGEVIASAAAVADAGDTDLVLEELGPQELRGLSGPVRLFRVEQRTLPTRPR